MISIILPIYNMQDYISECLESVLNQTFKDLEIICVNDFSMDNSMTIVKNYAKNDKRIKIVNNEKNRGLGGARNAGLDAATGEYIIFCDTDDKMMPDMVEKLYKKISLDNSDMAFCDVMLMDNLGVLTPYKPFHDLAISGYEQFLLPNDFEHFTNIWPSAWNKIYKKQIINENNMRYLENILYEDHTFYYEYILKCQKVSHVNEPLYVYRHQRIDSIMKDVSPRIFEVFKILDYINKIFQENLTVEAANKLMIKVSVRLLWERTMSFPQKLNAEHHRFLKEAKKYLKKYKKEDINKYKDPFIDNFSVLETKKYISVFKNKYKKI